MHQIGFCSLQTVGRQNELYACMYHTGDFIFTGSIRWNCWTVFFDKLLSFSKGHNVFWLAFFPHEGAVFQRNLCTLTQILRGGWRTEAYWPGDFSKEAFRNLLPFVFATLTTDTKARTIVLPGSFPLCHLLSFRVSFLSRVGTDLCPGQLVDTCCVPVPWSIATSHLWHQQPSSRRSRAEQGRHEANASLPH